VKFIFEFRSHTQQTHNNTTVCARARASRLVRLAVGEQRFDRRYNTSTITVRVYVCIYTRVCTRLWKIEIIRTVTQALVNCTRGKPQISVAESEVSAETVGKGPFPGR